MYESIGKPLLISQKGEDTNHRFIPEFLHPPLKVPSSVKRPDDYELLLRLDKVWALNRNKLSIG